ncbi:trypsin-like [Daphnia carinata]|uniref:trypsin-like n=1 Tax=Daphnia carinata TaxID=120202 RepID=UPI002579B5E7|nr:trypsin-like [Daphnia carinata]
MKLTTLLTALVFVAVAKGAPSEDRIYGGATVTTAIPYLVSITIDEQHVCGGWIYSPDWVVTAASCVYGILPSQLKVVVGQVSLIQPDIDEVWISVFRTHIFEGYDNATQLHDIAMLQMATSIPFVPAANILYEEPEVGIPAEFAGWGGTFEGGLPSTKLRKIATVTVPGDCSSYTALEFAPNYMLCAGSTTDTSSPCHYDEGSPLVQTFGGTTYAVGIMSKNKGCGLGAQPTLYTRLASYYSWLYRIGGAQPTP